MATNVVTLPIEELFLNAAHRKKLEAFATASGRADQSLTAEEYIRFLEDRGASFDPVRIREWFGEVRRLLDSYPTRDEAVLAVVAHINRQIGDTPQ
ncbi:MAG: hypothetical protein ACYDAL_02010 [Candidatus Dormibacteraceae bacterium]